MLTFTLSLFTISPFFISRAVFKAKASCTLCLMGFGKASQHVSTCCIFSGDQSSTQNPSATYLLIPLSVVASESYHVKVFELELGGAQKGQNTMFICSVLPFKESLKREVIVLSQ